MALSRIALFISGRGSNMTAIAERIRDGSLSAEIAFVAADREGAPGIETARILGLPTVVCSYAELGRERAERALAAAVHEHLVSWIVLAGFMRILSASFVHEFPERIVNIHPSLLPAFPGSEAIRQAWDYGVKVTGVTVHLVDERVDHGPILAQVAVPIEEDDTPARLEERIHCVEHDLYWRCLKDLLEGRFTKTGRRRMRRERP